MGSWLENSWASFWHEATKGAARSAAAKICVDLNFMPDLQFSGVQLELFHAFLAQSIVKQESREDSYLAGRPEVNAAKKVPMIGAVVNALVFIPNQVNDAVVTELDDEAQSLRLGLIGMTKDLWLTRLKKNKLNFELSEGFERMVTEVLNGLVEEEVDRELKPKSVQRAANLMASTYTVHKTKPREQLIVALKRTEQSIAGWNDWGQRDES